MVKKVPKMTNSVGSLVLHIRPPEFWMVVEAVVFHGFSFVHPWDLDVEGEVSHSQQFITQ
jgi:hypothetical protein